MKLKINKIHLCLKFFKKLQNYGKQKNYCRGWRNRGSG
jgi:hypothetical protein